MRIFVDAHKFDHSLQGTSTYIKGLYNALVKYDEIEITLCAQNIENLKKHFKDDRFNFIKLNSGSKYKRLAIEYPRLLAEGNYDYAHFQYIVPPLKKCKYINTIHDLLFLDFKQYFPWSYRFINGNLFRASAKISDIVLTVSQYSKEDINKYFHIPFNKIHITNNAVSQNIDSFIDVLEKYKLRKYILYVSRFEPRKNHLLLLKAFIDNKLYSQGFDLVFIGSKKEPIEIKSFESLIENIPENLKDYVKFFQGVSEEELNSFYSNASCFVFPSIAEGFGIPPLEAAINHCKVLCSDKTAMADYEFLKYRFDPYNLEDLKLKLNQILADTSYPYEEIRCKILDKYNWDKIAKDLYDLLRK